MKLELRNHLLPLLIIYLAATIVWFFQGIVWYQYVYLLFGFLWGSFLLDIDHLIYWLYTEPNLEESRLAQSAWKKRDILSLLKLLESTHMGHINLIFHHYFFQSVLALISLFVFTSSSSIFAKSLLLALNLHLLVDEIKDYFQDPEHLQSWLFARENKQLSIKSLKYFLIIFAFFNFFFTLSLIKSF